MSKKKSEFNRGPFIILYIIFLFGMFKVFEFIDGYYINPLDNPSNVPILKYYKEFLYLDADVMMWFFLINLGLLAIIPVAIRYIRIKLKRRVKEQYWDRMPDELPPYAVASLIGMADKGMLGPILAGEIALFIEKGYIKPMLSNGGYSFKILRNPCEEDNMCEYQMRLYEWLFKDIAGEDGILLKDDFEKAFAGECNMTIANLGSIALSVNDSMKEKGYYEKDYVFMYRGLKSTNLILGIGAILMSSIVMQKIYFTPLIIIFLLVEIGKLSLCIEDQSKRLTEEGLTSYNQWLSFKMFLQNYSKFEDRGIRDLAVWKEFLAYGTALDLSDKLTSEVDDAVTIQITNEVKRIIKEVVGRHLMDRIRH